MKPGIDILWKSVFILWFLIPAAGAGAQNETVRFSAAEMPAKQMMAEIEEQTGYRFGFESSVFDASRTVHPGRTPLTLGKALDKLVGNDGFDWSIHGKFIIISQRKGSGKTGDGEKKPRGNEGDDPDDPAEPGRPPVRANDPIGVGREPTQGAVSPKTHSNLWPPARSFPTAITVPKPWAVKTDLLYSGIALAINFGAEIAVAPSSTLGLTVGFNPWVTMPCGDRSLRHWTLLPEYRRWLGEPFRGHFFGIHLICAGYDIQKIGLFDMFDRLYRYRGWILGAGATYGYSWRLSKRWGLEFDLGIGLANINRRRFDPGGAVAQEIDNRIYFGPTRAGICLVFLSGRR